MVGQLTPVSSPWLLCPGTSDSADQVHAPPERVPAMVMLFRLELKPTATHDVALGQLTAVSSP